MLGNKKNLYYHHIISNHLKSGVTMILLNVVTSAYLFSILLMAVWTNIRPIHINNLNETEVTVAGNTNKEELGDADVIVLINLVVLAVVGKLKRYCFDWNYYSSAIFGNLLTLVGLPYIRTKYGQEFSILQLNSITLILHLSLCDLLYALLAFPHFIHSHLYKTNIYSVEVCFFLGMFRNLVAYTDLSNLALISCCLARQFLCR